MSNGDVFFVALGCGGVLMCLDLWLDRYFGLLDDKYPRED